MESVEIASFTETIKPSFVQKTLKNWWLVASALDKHGLYGTLDQAKCSITVSTTTRTKSRDVLDRARGCIILLIKTAFSRDVVIRVLDGRLHYDYIEIGFQEGGIAAVHGMKKEVYIRNRKNLFEHIKEIGRLSNKCTVDMREDVIGVVGRLQWTVMKFREVATNCIAKNKDPRRYVESLDAIVTTNRVIRRLTNLRIKV